MIAPLVRVDDLHVRPAEHVAGAALTGLNLTINAGEVHAIMGPIGSGTSTLGAALMGASTAELVSGTVEFRGDDISGWRTDERAKAGMFLAFQQPQPLHGVSVLQLLSQSLAARKGVGLSASELRVATQDWIKRFDMVPSFVDRHLDGDFSVGERKCNELMQMAILAPEVAILDETDADLDASAVRTVARGIHEVRLDNPDMGVLLISPQQRLIAEVAPDHIHLMVDGRIVASGGMELVTQLEHSGYESFLTTASVSA